MKKNPKSRGEKTKKGLRFVETSSERLGEEGKWTAKNSYKGKSLVDLGLSEKRRVGRRFGKGEGARDENRSVAHRSQVKYVGGGERGNARTKNRAPFRGIEEGGEFGRTCGGNWAWDAQEEPA